ncbi:MAG: tetratricopeptide repeat protein [Bacteroidales bacterium]|nr:tetratricopeptide repeat protein [Bacteroidales bacterium]
MNLFYLILIFTLFFLMCHGYSKDAEEYLTAGKTYYQSGNYQDALIQFLKYAEKKPKEMASWYWLGWTNYRLGKYNEAIEQLTRANTITETWDAYLGLGECYYALTEYGKAVENFSRAMKLKPDEASPYQWLGFCYFNLQNYNEAIENLLKANTIQESVTNYNWLGNCYLSLEDYETALKYSIKFLELHPKNPDLWLPHNRIGWNYYYLKMYFDAIEHFRESIRIKPENGSYLGLCKVYDAMGEYEKTREILNILTNRAESENEKAQIKFLQGYNHVAEGRFAAAAKVFGQKNTLGIEMRNIPTGLKVIVVFKNGPAAMAGLKPGDILVEFAGIDLAGILMPDFITTILPQPAFGTRVQLKIYRDGYHEEKYIYPGLSEEIYAHALNDPELVSQRAQVSDLNYQVKANIAVIDLNTSGMTEDEAMAITARVRSELFNSCKYNVLEREDMRTLLEEQGLQQTGLTAEQNLVQAGKIRLYIKTGNHIDSGNITGSLVPVKERAEKRMKRIKFRIIFDLSGE